MAYPISGGSLGEVQFASILFLPFCLSIRSDGATATVIRNIISIYLLFSYNTSIILKLKILRHFNSYSGENESIALVRTHMLD